MGRTTFPFSRSFATTPPPPPPQSGTLPPPATTKGSIPKATIGQATTSAAAKAWRPSFFILAPTFVFTHFTLACALVPPIYLILRTTNLSNTLLAGPQGAWFLSRRVPTWIPGTVVDGLVGGIPADGKASQRPTVEELIERLARRGIGIVWDVSRSAASAFKKGDGEENALAKAAMKELRGGLGSKQEQVRDKADGFKDQIKGFTSRQAQGAVSEIKFGQIRDGVAAWVLVKILFPLRLPISLFLTPRVVRGLRKAFR